MPRKSKKRSELDALLDLAGEAGVLKSVRRSGWWMLGMKHAESVADHSFRAALIAYLLARMERQDPYPAVMIALINDLHEARINDLHKVGHRYIDFRAAEWKASREQLERLPPRDRLDEAAGSPAQNPERQAAGQGAGEMEERRLVAGAGYLGTVGNCPCRTPRSSFLTSSLKSVVSSHSR